MDNTACLTLARVITGVRKRANTRAAEAPAKINFATRVILFQLKILLFARAPMRFCCTAKDRLHVTGDTDTSETMTSNTT